jgi:WXXGXW repeat (2 copies)
MRTYMLMLGVGLAMATPLVSTATPDNTPPSDLVKGIEIQARGQIHEAFAQPLDLQPEAAQPTPKEPPPPIPEQPPEQRPEGDNVQWIPGYWAWDADRNDYLWISGVYRNAPPGRTYVAGYWEKTQDGFRWVAGFWAPANQAEIPYTTQPPPASPDNGPSMPPPDVNSFYSPGYWAYNNQAYVWRPGFYMADRPGMVWVPAHWSWTPAGFVFIAGYWDYPLENRGLLFAPVCFAEPYWQQPNWCYQPTFVVRLGALLDSCFVRRGHYYFGDYYGSAYARAGYHPWFGARYDPLGTYYRRHNPQFVNGLPAAYAARNGGRAAVPARVYAANTANSVVTSIANVNVRTTSINASQRAVQTAGAQRLRDLAQTRMQSEAHLAHSSGSNTRRVFNLSEPGRPSAQSNASAPAARILPSPASNHTQAPRISTPPTVAPSAHGNANAVHHSPLKGAAPSAASAPSVTQPKINQPTPARVYTVPSAPAAAQVHSQPKVTNVPSVTQPRINHPTPARVNTAPATPRVANTHALPKITNAPAATRVIHTPAPARANVALPKASNTNQVRRSVAPAAPVHAPVRQASPPRVSAPAPSGGNHGGGNRGGGNHGGGNHGKKR